MLIRHLSYFVALARERHFARAAAACNITQPALSAAIRKLKADLGVPLVSRSNRLIGFTDEGERLLTWARQILLDHSSLVADLSGARRGLTDELRLGVIPAAMPAVALLTAPFLAANAAARVAIRSLTSRAIAEGLDAYELDGGLTYLENEPIAHVRKTPLYDERYVLVVPRGHRLADRASATWREAAGEQLCLLSRDMQYRRIIDRLTQSAGVGIDPAITSNSFLAVLSHLRQGGWASITPRSFLHLLGEPRDLVAIDLVEPDHREAVGLVVADREPRSPMTRALLAAAGEARTEVLER